MNRIQHPLRRPLQAALTILSAALLAGCVTNPPMAQQGSAAMAVGTTQAAWVAPARQGAAMETDGVYVNKRSIEVREQVLPPVFRQRLSMKLDVSMTLSQVVYAISRETGMRISLAEETRADAQKPLVVAGHNLDAPLRDVLDQVTALANMAWRHRDGAVEIYRIETRTFEIAAAPGVTEIVSTNETVSGNSTLKTSSTVDVWGSIQRDLQALISPAGRLSVAEATRTVTVTDSLDALAAVQAYVRELNASRTRQVAVAVAVYSVDTAASKAAGALNWNGVYERMSQSVDYSARPRLVASADSSFGAVIPANTDMTDANKRAFVTALQSLGGTTVIAEASRLILNGEVAPMTNTRGQGGQTQGVSLLVAPSIFGQGQVNLTAAFDMAFAGGTNRAFTEKFSVQSGQTYVFGFQPSEQASESAGAKTNTRTIVVTITPTIVNGVR